MFGVCSALAACGSVSSSNHNDAAIDTPTADAWSASCVAPQLITPIENGDTTFSGPCLHAQWYLQALNGTTTPTAPGRPMNTVEVVPTAITLGSNSLDKASTYAVHVSGEGQTNISTTTFSYAQLTLALNTLSATQVGTVDASAFTGIQFYGKITVAASGLRLTVADLYTDPSGGMCSPSGGKTGCFDAPGYQLAASADWKLYKVPFADLMQIGFGNPSPTGGLFPKDKIINLKWDIGIPAQGATQPWEIWVDDLTFY